MSEIDLEKEFESNFNCYAEHDADCNTLSETEKAMTKEKFIEVVAALLKR